MGSELPFTIPNHWEATTLNEACKRSGGDIQTGPFGSQLHAYDYILSGIPVIMPQNISTDSISDEGIAYISAEDAQRLSRYLAREGDIIYSRRGDVERRALVTSQEDGWLCGTGCLRIRFNSIEVDPHYTYYYLGHPSIRKWIGQHAVGATMPNLNTSILGTVPFALPPIHEQRAIAHILSSLDDKIELNRKMNATLEETARAIFQSWFVDFDPVHAKAAGRAPAGMDAATAALFPDSFEEVQGRMVPKRWQVKEIGEITNVVGGSTPSTKEASFWNEGNIHWATPKDLASLTNPLLFRTERCITDLGLKQISSGLLPKGTVLLSSRAPIGYLALTYIDTAINQGFIALVCDKGVPNYYVLFWVQSNLDLIKSRANGTTFLEVSKTNFRSLLVTLPSDLVLLKFIEIVEPFYETIRNNLEQSYQLTIIRDALLPKLMTGEIRVRDLDSFLEKTNG